ENQNTVEDDVPVSSKFKWRIEKVPELNEKTYFSPVFSICSCKWRLAFFRRDINGDDYLSIYVVSVECTNLRYEKFSIGFDDFILFDELIDPSNGHMVDDACIIEVELCSFSKLESIEVNDMFLPFSCSKVEFHITASQRPCSISSKKSGGVAKTFSGRKRVAVEGEKAVGGGEILDGKEVAEIGKENKRIIEKGEVISQSTKGRKFRAGFTPIWSLINIIYKKEKLSFKHPCKTHSKNHWTKMPEACNKVLKWCVRGPGKKEHYFVFTHWGNEYKLRGKERNLTKWDKSYSQSEFYLTYFGSSTIITKCMLENNIVGLVKSGEKNEDLVKLIGLFMCETLFFTAHSGSQLNKKYLKLFDSPWKINSLSWPDLVHDHLIASLNNHKDTTLVSGCIWFAEHIKSGVKETQIAEGLPRFSRWNLHNICSAILIDFESLEISEGFIEAYTEVEKQTLNSLRMRIHQQDQLNFCKAGECQPQQNEIIMQEVRSTVQGDKGDRNVDQEQLLIQQNKYDDLRMSVKRRWDAKENHKLNGKTVHYEVEELLNDFYFKAYPDEKKRKIKKQRKVKFVSAIFK
ncbi:hypothetical protein MKX03_008293, partial [Papaver bracteatum]